MKFANIISFAVGALLATAVPAQELTITTGGATGTYIKIGQQIRQIVARRGINLKVAESRGSVHNLQRLLGYEGVDTNDFYHLAIVQEDVLADLRRYAERNEILKSIVDKVRIVMPLYDEEVHIFVKKDGGVREFSDLADRFIAVGSPGSGTFVTARYLHFLAGFPWAAEDDRLLDGGGVSGLEALGSYFTDAVFQVAGAPASLGMEVVKADDGIELAEITNPAIFETEGSPYKRATIKARTYPWLDRPVKTAAVGSILVAFDYRGDNCEAIGTVFAAIVEGIDELRAQGHPKWREVEPLAAMNRKDMYSCARDALN